VPDREVAARLAGLRRTGVDLERRLRGDPLVAPDSETYWRGQIDGWRAALQAELTHYPFQLRALQAPIATDEPERSWSRDALAEIVELRRRLDLTIERIAEEQ
jgi:hypothetical protein